MRKLVSGLFGAALAVCLSGCPQGRPAATGTATSAPISCAPDAAGRVQCTTAGGPIRADGSFNPYAKAPVYQCTLFDKDGNCIQKTPVKTGTDGLAGRRRRRRKKSLNEFMEELGINDD